MAFAFELATWTRMSHQLFAAVQFLAVGDSHLHKLVSRGELGR